MDSFDYSDEALERISEIFRAFSQPLRLKIIRELHDGPRNVTELHQVIGGSQANISKHLSVLHREGIVSRRKNGVENIYQIADEDVNEICRRVCDYFETRVSEQQNLMGS